MKAGTIVECIYNYYADPNGITVALIMGFRQFPQYKNHYCIREIFTNHGATVVVLEEVRNITLKSECPECNGTECNFPIEHFREVIFPDALTTEIAEMLQGELVEVGPCKEARELFEKLKKTK